MYMLERVRARARAQTRASKPRASVAVRKRSHVYACQKRLERPRSSTGRPDEPFGGGARSERRKTQTVKSEGAGRARTVRGRDAPWQSAKMPAKLQDQELAPAICSARYEHVEWFGEVRFPQNERGVLL